MGTDFRVDVGRLAVIGPTVPKALRTCVSERSCAPNDLQGHFYTTPEAYLGPVAVELSDKNAIMILDTCGVAPVIPFIAPVRQSRGMGKSKNVQHVSGHQSAVGVIEGTTQWNSV